MTPGLLFSRIELVLQIISLCLLDGWMLPWDVRHWNLFRQFLLAINTTFVLSNSSEKLENMTVVLLFLLLTTALLYRLVAEFFFSDLRSISGPLLARLTNLWRLIDTWKGRHELTVQNLHRKYDSVIRIGPNNGSISDSDAVDRIFGAKAEFPKVSSHVIILAVRGLWLTHQQNNFNNVMRRHDKSKPVPTIVTVEDGKPPTDIRKPVAHVFTTKELVKFEPVVDKTICSFLWQLDQGFITGSSDGSKCDIHGWNQNCGFLGPLGNQHNTDTRQSLLTYSTNYYSVDPLASSKKDVM